MSKEIERRLAAAERRLKRGRTELEVIVIRGGLDGGDPTFFNAAGARSERASDESFAAFKARVVAEAVAAGQKFVIIGGLPDVGS